MDAVESECGYTSHPMCLWTPPIDALSDVSTRIGQFCQQVQQKHNIKFSTYKDLHKWSINNYGLFWEECWHYFDVIHSAPYDEVIDKSKSISDIPEWFTGSRLNFAENMLRFRDDRVAVYAVSEGAYTVRRRTYAELYADVTRLASAMKALGIQQGDRVVGYIPNSIEAVVAMLAAASIGAVWSSTSPDFGVFGVLERFTQIQPSLIFSINAVTYNGKVHPHLEKLQQVVQGLPDLKKVVIIPHSKQGNDKIDLSNITNGCLYEDFCKLGDNNCSELEFRQLPFNHPLYIMYSSGTTGVPKCMVHSAGGTLMKHLEEHILQSNMTRNDVMLYYTTTGWMMWNWYVSVLAVGGTIVCYDGSPLVPHINVIWDLVDNLKVTILGTSAKWLSALQEKGTSPGKTHSLKTLRTILSTGSPLKPASYDYVYNEIKSDVLLGSITGGTDIIACFAGNNATVPVYRGEIQSAHLGCAIESWNEDGKAVSGESGELVCLKPFPSMPTHFWNDANGEKYRSAYFRKFEGVWAHGDYCLINENTGGIWMLGRSDGTLNPGGVRFGSAEVYHVVESFKEIQDSLCIGQKSRDGCDERVVLFLKMVPGFAFSAEIVKQIQLTIRKELTPRHVPSLFLEIADIPYTHSGKKVEIAVKKILNGEDVKSRSAYANPDSLDLYYNIPLLQNY